MHPDHERYKLFSRRAAILAGAKVALMSALVRRKYYLQVLQSGRYTMLAEDNRINVYLLSPPRGLIIDRFGVLLADNRQDYRAVIIAERTDDVARTLAALAPVLHIDDAERSRILRAVGRRRSFVPITIRENLTWEQVSRIEVNAPDLPGVIIEAGLSRHYPEGEAAAHLVGYVGAVDENEVTGDPLLELPDFRIGKSGVQRYYDATLRGSAGTSQVEINAHGRVIRELARRQGKPGGTVTLTLDAEIQRFAVERLGKESGSAVVLDVHGGEVLVLASTPSFDPSAFDKGISTKYWQELVGNPRAPLTNKAITGQYAPGSTFKLVVVMAALEAGVVSKSNEVYCRGFINFGDSRFHCWKRRGHGWLALMEAITRSCDVFFYDLAMRTGIDRIAAMAKRLGFGEKVGLDLIGERKGLVPDRDWKRAQFEAPWQKGETLIAGIGQGYLLATPLQLAVMTARLVNGGYAVTPHLTGSAGPDLEAPEPRPPFPSLGVSSAALEFVREGMRRVVNEPIGTAYRARIKEPDAPMGGKTGTSQVRRITMAERARGVLKNEDIEWARRDHALFVGYAPVTSPRYAIAVVVEHGGGGSRAAAPVARDILRQVLRRDPARRGGGRREG